MVLDTLSHASWYAPLLAGLPAAFEFLRRPGSDMLPDGRYPIDGDRLFALVQTYDTKPFNDGLPEAHRRYADVQVVTAGAEWFGYAPLGTQPVEQPYDPERDILFVRGDTTPCPLTPGLFALFLPQDAHLPGRTINTPTRVRKIVIKILLAEKA